MDHDQAPSQPAGETSSDCLPHLSTGELDRLTSYKSRYSLEANGFSTVQAGRLLFFRWLYRQGAVLS